ncbi:hypothetical protein HAZT_HAZT011953 [Hyalella azteca]|uniref:RING-type domain-containing protein n=1 Tax=Hyalella azteca TaxID=294128 RepID=A0A6A0GQF9_HYAAZ|nr:hypothetical protein HAZT_HAZT011953 [Hyalella azteca]
MSDHVRCYHCGQGLRNWEENDEPWVEHARWYPNCHYVLLSKGIEFIDQVRRENPPFFKCNSGKNGTDSCRGAETSDLAHQASTSPYVSHSYSADVRSNYRVHITDEQLDVLMDLDVQRAVLEMGFARPAVKRALRYKIEETGVPFFNLETCIERVLACSEESNANDEAHRQQEAKLAAYQREREDRIHQSHEDSLLREVNNISTTTAAVERTSQSEGEDVVNTQRIERLSSLMPSAASPPRGSRTPIITSPVMPPRRFNAAVSNLISDETSSQGSSTQSNSSLSDDVQSLDRTFDTSQLEEYFMEHESMEPVERVVQFLNESARDAASNNTNSTHTSPVNEAFNDTSTPRASPIPRSMDFTTGSEPEIISSSGMDVNVLTSLTPPLSQSPSLPPSSPSSSSSTMSLAADPISLEMLRQVDRVISKADATQKHVRRNLSNCSAKSSTSSKSSVCNLENCELMAVEAGGSSDGEALSLEEQLLKSEQKVRNLTEQVERLREGRLCKICMDADLSVVLLPCTHMATCSNCTLALSTCPICRSSIKHVIRPNVVA